MNDAVATRPLRHFGEFCFQCHQDVGIDFGYDTRLIAYGVSWFSYTDRDHVQAVLTELKALKTDADFRAALKVAARTDVYLVTEGREREDIAKIIEAIERRLKDDPQNHIEANRGLARFKRDIKESARK